MSLMRSQVERLVEEMNSTVKPGSPLRFTWNPAGLPGEFGIFLQNGSAVHIAQIGADVNSMPQARAVVAVSLKSLQLLFGTAVENLAANSSREGAFRIVRDQADQPPEAEAPREFAL